jgi:predicted  nucleic acid-binding Zn-ribbon protein
VQNAFDQLEERVKKAAEALRRLQIENEALRAEVNGLEGRLRVAEKAAEASPKKASGAAESARRASALESEVASLRQERQEVRNRLARLVELLEELE